MKHSFVTTCKGRLKYLKQTAPYLHGIDGIEQVIVDFDCPDGTSSWVKKNLPKAVLVSIKDRPRFLKCEALNYGIRASSGDFLYFIDSDIFVKNPLGLIKRLEPYLSEEEFIIPGNRLDGVYGVLIAPRKSVIKRGYNERLIHGYGLDDDEMLWHLAKIQGLRPRIMERDWFRHISHPERIRTTYYDEKNTDNSTARNREIVLNEYAQFGVSGNTFWHEEWCIPLEGSPSVTVDYVGNLGNKLFEYAAGRILAEDLGMSFGEIFDGEGIVEVSPFKGGESNSGPVTVLTDYDFPFRDDLPRDRQYRLSGYFQKAEWYLKNRKRIESFYSVKPVEKNKKDLLVSLRLGDYKEHGWVIHPNWYRKIIGGQEFDRLHIVTDERDSFYLSMFKRWNPIIHCDGKHKDFETTMSFDRVILSNSTFSWWAAFFSKPSKLWTFKPWIGVEASDLAGHENAIVTDGNFMERHLIHA